MKILIQRKSRYVETAEGQDKDGWITAYEYSSTSEESMKLDNWRIVLENNPLPSKDNEDNQ